MGGVNLDRTPLALARAGLWHPVAADSAPRCCPAILPTASLVDSHSSVPAWASASGGRRGWGAPGACAWRHPGSHPVASVRARAAVPRSL